MNAHNEAFQNSLRCLAHPLSIISITVLLLNDHVFKVIGPSWLTGKLSDFAGLFFFPFIVAAGLSLLLPRFDLPSRQMGQIAFGFVVVWFVLLKTSPLFNSITAQLASIFVGSPTLFVLDMTDIIGIITMIPAWRLWNQRRLRKVTRFAYIVLSTGALAAIATSPIDWTITSVTDLEYSEDGVLYAADKETFGTESYPVAKSSDGGLTWERDFDRESLPKDERKILPVQVCHDLNQFGETCYRVTRDHQFEFLNTSWMKVFPSSSLSVKAHDIIIFPWDEKEYMLVAIGEAGILRRELPDGNWEIIPVINARSW